MKIHSPILEVKCIQIYISMMYIDAWQGINFRAMVPLNCRFSHAWSKRVSNLLRWN
jgi:hypothetical protein